MNRRSARKSDEQQSPVVRDQHFVAWTADQDEQAEDAMKGGRRRRRRGRSRIKRSDINFLVICCDYDCHRRSQKLVTHPLSQLAQEPGLSVRQAKQAFLMFTLIDKERVCVGESFVSEFCTSSVARSVSSCDSCVSGGRTVQHPLRDLLIKWRSCFTQRDSYWHFVQA